MLQGWHKNYCAITLHQYILLPISQSILQLMVLLHKKKNTGKLLLLIHLHRLLQTVNEARLSMEMTNVQVCRRLVNIAMQCCQVCRSRMI